MLNFVLLSLFFCNIAFSSEQCTSLKNCLLEKQTEPLSSSSSTQKNLKGERLKPCSFNPMTGFTRSGYCEYFPNDQGRHLVCAEVGQDFLSYTKRQGNDLSSSNPRYGFKGLVPGDRWCLCSSRAQEAMRAGVEIKIVDEATNAKAWD